MFDGPLSFIPADRWEATLVDPVAGAKESDFLFHGRTIDRSRAFVLFGKEAPYYIRLRLQGWGMSILEGVLPQFTDWIKAQDVILEMLDEAKIDIVKINQLAEILASAGGTNLIKQRLDIVSANKNYKSMIAMDAADDYQQKQMSFSGLPELLKEIRILIAYALRIPVSKLCGLS